MVHKIEAVAGDCSSSDAAASEAADGHQSGQSFADADLHLWWLCRALHAQHNLLGKLYLIAVPQCHTLTDTPDVRVKVGFMSRRTSAMPAVSWNDCCQKAWSNTTGAACVKTTGVCMISCSRTSRWEVKIASQPTCCRLPTFQHAPPGCWVLPALHELLQTKHQTCWYFPSKLWWEGHKIL